MAKTASQTTSRKPVDKPAPLARLARIMPWLLIICGVAGLIATLFLTYDQVQIWQNPHYQPGCNLNPLISCGGVITSGKGELAHIPGPFFGMMAFPVLITVGVALLAGAKFKRWFWQGLQAGTVLGVVFALWMFWVSLFQIHALCPFCLTVDAFIYILFWYLTLYNLQQEHIKSPAWFKRAVDFSMRHHLDIIVAWFLIVAGYTLYHFWYFFGQHI